MQFAFFNDFADEEAAKLDSLQAELKIAAAGDGIECYSYFCHTTGSTFPGSKL